MSILQHPYFQSAIVVMINSAVASVAFCLFVLFAATCIRRRRITLRYTALNSSSIVLLAIPVIMAIAIGANFGIVETRLFDSVLNEQTIGFGETESVTTNNAIPLPQESGEESNITVETDSVSEQFGLNSTLTNTSGEALSDVHTDDVITAEPDPDALVSDTQSTDGNLLPTLPATSPDSVPADGSVGDQPGLHDETRTSSSRAEQANNLVEDVPYLTVAISILCFFWLIGSLVAAARFFRGLLLLQRLKHSLRPTACTRISGMLSRCLRDAQTDMTVEVKESTLAPVPLTLGIKHPCIILPSGLAETLDEDQLHGVLAHELAHVLRNDNRAALLQKLASCVYWWNPLVVVITRRTQILREVICDRFVMTCSNNSAAFPEALIQVAEWCSGRRQRSLPVTTLLGPLAEVKLRLQQMMNSGNEARLKPTAGAQRRLLTMMTVVAGFLLLPVFHGVPHVTDASSVTEASTNSTLPEGPVVDGQPASSESKPEVPDLAERSALEDAYARAKTEFERLGETDRDYGRKCLEFQHAQLRLRLFDLNVAMVERHAGKSDDELIARIEQLKVGTRIRWGEPVGGLQLGFARTDERDEFNVGDKVQCQLLIQNISDKPISRTIIYRSNEKVSASVDAGNRIVVHSATDLEAPLEVHVDLEPGEVWEVERCQSQIDLSGLRSGDYYLEAYMLVSWKDDKNSQEYHRLRTPGWTVTPRDLRLEFTVIGSQG